MEEQIEKSPETIINTSPPTSHKKKYFLYGMLAIVIILFLISIGYYLGITRGSMFSIVSTEENISVTPTSTSTPDLAPADWRSITRTIWSFKVPSDWVYLECSNAHILVGPGKDDRMGDCGFDGYPLPINLSRWYEGNLTIQQDTNLPDFKIAITNRKDILVDGIPGIQQTETTTCNCPADGVYTNVYLQSINTSITLADQKYSDIFDIFLTTLKLKDRNINDDFLLVPTPSPTSVAWQTYNDKDYGYSIRYPQEWKFTRTYGKDIPKMAPTDILSAFEISHSPYSGTLTIVGNVLDRHNATTIDEWIEKYDLNYPKNATKKSITFRGIPATQYTYTYQHDMDNIETIYFLSGNYAYRLTYEEPTISDITRDTINSFDP